MHSQADELESRVTALARYHILDTPPEPVFEDIVLLAAQICQTPVALITLVDRDRQWFKSRTGFALGETPLAQSVCAITLRQRHVLVVPDLSTDPRTSSNPLVADEPKLRFYAGAPIVTPDDVAIGTVCVIDHVPRPAGLSPGQCAALEALARQVAMLLEQRRLLADQRAQIADGQRIERSAHAEARMSREAAAVLREQNQRFRLAEEAGGAGTFEVDLASNTLSVSPELCRIFGLPVAETYPASTLEALVVAEDADLRSNAGTRSDGTAALEVEYRIRRAGDGGVRWIARRALFVRDAAGTVVQMFGLVRDITERKVLQIRQAALLDLGDRLRDAETSAEVSGIAAEVLGTTLAASRAGYAQLDLAAEQMVVERDWTVAGTASLKGRGGLGRFRATVERLAKGETVAVADVSSASWLASEIDRYRAIGTGAVLKVPLLAKRQLIGLLYAHQLKPRAWSEGEISFAQGVADRTHSALAKLQAEADQKVLNRELNHRMKNTLAVVQAIAMQTLRTAADQPAVERYIARLHALSTAHDILLQHSWTAAGMRTAIEAVLGRVAQLDRFELQGPNISLGPRTTLSISLLLHELATNAIKHGALSSEAGRVALRWRVASPDAEPEVILDWIESGGPPPAEVRSQGFGSRLIRLGLVGTGQAEMSFPPQGFRSRMRASLSQMQQS